MLNPNNDRLDYGQILSPPVNYHLDCAVERLGGMEIPVPYNPIIEKQIVPSAEDIVNKVKEMV